MDYSRKCLGFRSLFQHNPLYNYICTQFLGIKDITINFPTHGNQFHSKSVDQQNIFRNRTWRANVEINKPTEKCFLNLVLIFKQIKESCAWPKH